jgi:RNA polymerase sigma-70 factor (ECF subfamily)
MEDLNGDGPADDAPSPEQIAINRDELRHLAVAIAAMPPQMHKAFTLRRMNGLSQREIARELDLSESTVEKHISRGIRFLTDWFGSGGKTAPKSSKGTQQEIHSSDGDERLKSGG